MLCLKIYSWDISVSSENDEQLHADDDDEFDLEELEAKIHKTAIDDTWDLKLWLLLISNMLQNRSQAGAYVSISSGILHS